MSLSPMRRVFWDAGDVPERSPESEHDAHLHPGDRRSLDPSSWRDVQSSDVGRSTGPARHQVVRHHAERRALCRVPGLQPDGGPDSVAVLATLPSATQTTILGNTFFPQLLAAPFLDGLRVAFAACVALSIAAAAASWMRGRRYIHDLEVASQAAASQSESVAVLEG